MKPPPFLRPDNQLLDDIRHAAHIVSAVLLGLEELTQLLRSNNLGMARQQRAIEDAKFRNPIAVEEKQIA